jgi:hypothetical protein
MPLPRFPAFQASPEKVRAVRLLWRAFAALPNPSTLPPIPPPPPPSTSLFPLTLLHELVSLVSLSALIHEFNLNSHLFAANSSIGHHAHDLLRARFFRSYSSVLRGFVFILRPIVHLL